MTAQALQELIPGVNEPAGAKPRGLTLNESLDRQTRFQETIHEHHWDDRAKIINALVDPVSPMLHPAARRMAACAQGASFYIDPGTESVRPWLSRCGHRLCPFCSNARSASTTEDLTALMVEHHADRMMILTVRSCDLPLDLQVQQLLHCFKKLRARAQWKRFVDGGVYVIEITLNEKTGQWHPHLHILYKGNYYPQKQLSAMWFDITDGSNIVWVSQVRDHAGAARELAKYIGKPQRISTLTPRQIRDYAYAVKSVRMVQTFGCCHGKKPVDADIKPEQPKTDERVRLSTLIHIARSGHAEAVVLLTWLCRKYTVFGRYVNHEMPQLVADPHPADRTLAMLAVLRGERPPPRDGPEEEMKGEELDHKICQAFVCYQAQLALGVFGNVTCYYKTGTEQIDGNQWEQPKATLGGWAKP